MTTSKTPVGVIGAGNMGRNHVRVYDQLDEAELVEVVEPDSERAAEIADEYDVVVHPEVSALERAEAVSIATPNELHEPVAVECAERGIDVLVEKPLATTLDAASRIVEVATENDVTLQVGHIERFNPAVEMVAQILEGEEVIALESHRLGPFNDHLTDEDVVFDLMIHDIDVMCSLVDAGITGINAVGTSPRSKQCDYAVAQLEFEDRVLGTATASHVTHGKVRRLDVTTMDAFITLNYQQQDVTVQRRGVEHTTTTHASHQGYRTETVTESPFIRTREPLELELEHFLECVSTGREPMVDGDDGVRAVELASEVARDVQTKATSIADR